MITCNEFKAILKDPWLNNLKKNIDGLTSKLKTKFPDDIISYTTMNLSNEEIRLEIKYSTGKPIFSSIYKLLRTELDLTLDLYSENEDTCVRCSIKHSKQSSIKTSTLTLVFNRFL